MSYKSVLYSLEHILLRAPPDDAKRLIIAMDEYEARPPEAGVAAHAISYDNDPIRALDLGARAVTVWRYGGVETRPSTFGQSGYNSMVTWTVILDILVEGRALSNLHDNAVNTGIYNPLRGTLVNYVIDQYRGTPILEQVKLKDALANESDPQRRRWLYAQYGTAGETPYELESGVNTAITNVEITDETDPALWTLMSSAGGLRTFEGWWPASLHFDVTTREHLQ